MYRFVLGIRSAVFRGMFYGSLPEKGDNAIDISDIQRDAFGNMLSFLYTDTMDNLTADNVFFTMFCADKYDLPLLVKICSDFVVNQLTPTNCLETLKQVQSFSQSAVGSFAVSIVERCLTLIDANTSAILQSDQFTEISQDVLQSILQRDTLSAEENDVYLAVERWSAAACAGGALDTSAANRRQMLGAALFHVRFPLLTNTQLADGPGKSGLLTDAELLSVFMYQSATVKPEISFPTERRTEQRQVVIAATIFQAGDEVFVHTASDTGEFWEPARICEVHPQHVTFTLFRSWIMPGTATADKIIRAKDILKRAIWFTSTV
ncbi:BTB/POZ domain-containing protein 6-B-like [Paramacrobiotus metropolitanus]|uniref:BTB/POZ domain-containing protein 6-B-like n=1 Tax=Paramacrobiotus metropolitanus TaxID=2943436 RepID=UPI00244592EF|nr:BTB/POZ domain-containing protein 6-B-like [Paramacrobiotus metropolitanus]